jgi:hypothetical protein
VLKTETDSQLSLEAALSDVRRALRSMPTDSEFGTSAVRHLMTCALRAGEALAGGSGDDEVTGIAAEVRSAAVCAGMLTSELRTATRAGPSNGR